jgi:hypothetical protein
MAAEFPFPTIRWTADNSFPLHTDRSAIILIFPSSFLCTEKVQTPLSPSFYAGIVRPAAPIVHDV